jgi:hypothetical protein
MPELRRIENAYPATRIAQRFPERRAGLSQAAHPIDNHRDEHTFAYTFDQGRTEGLANLVVTDDVVFQQHALTGATDRRKPGGIVSFGIDQQLDVITAKQGCARRTAQGLFGEQSPWRRW